MARAAKRVRKRGIKRRSRAATPEQAANERIAGSLLTLVFARLADRSSWPRRSWWPIVNAKELPAGEGEWRRQHDEVSRTIRRVMMTLIGYSFFCLLTLGASDESLIRKDATIKIPFAGIDVSYVAFLGIGPAVLIGLIIYLHIFVERWWLLGHGRKHSLPLPFIFNMGSRVSDWLSGFIFYWLSPLLLLAFALKAAPRPLSAYSLLVLMILTTFSLIWLQIRRCPDERRRWCNPVLWSLVPVLITALVTASIVPQGIIQRPLSLYQVDLHNEDLEGINLAYANVERANFQDAKLRQAHLYRAKLRGANLRGTDLRRAQLSQADLGGVDLTGASLNQAMLDGASLASATLSGAKLISAQLVGADLQEVQLQGADLRGANLQSANLRDAIISEAELHLAQLKEADLSDASLSNADLFGAVLRGARLKGANLRGANVLWADFMETRELSASQVRSAVQWERALYSQRLIKELELPVEHNANLAEQRREALQAMHEEPPWRESDIERE